jgi:hypothetical protein
MCIGLAAPPNREAEVIRLDPVWEKSGERWVGPTRSSPNLHPLDGQVILGGKVAFSSN